MFCPKALWTWISNWAKISADPGCLCDWTTDILCLFSPRTCRGFQQNDRDVTGVDNALCAEYLGLFNEEWKVWIWSPRGYKEPRVSVLQGWMSALSTEILYKFQKSRFGRYTQCRHRINHTLAEEMETKHHFSWGPQRALGLRWICVMEKAALQQLRGCIAKID